MRKWIILFIFCVLLSGCENQAANPIKPTTTSLALATLSPVPTVTVPEPAPTTSTPAVTLPVPTPAMPTATQAVPTIAPPTPAQPTATPSPLVSASSTQVAQVVPARSGGVPAFDHIIVILFENRDYNEVIGNQNLPNFNRLANENVLFTNYYAVAHPSLPNYLALTGGSTFGITSDCGGCFVQSTSLPDLIEASGRSWKTYQEDMPAPCTVAGTKSYDENHDPFIYFDAIRTDKLRCERSVVPLTQLDADLSANQLPNYAFIMPNICNSAHDCNLTVADAWLGRMVQALLASPAMGQNAMIFIVFDESSSDNRSCCGLPAKAGGRVPAILISPQARSGFQDNSPLSHYSLLKTILLAWNLPGLGFTENPATVPITAPWK